MRTLVTALAFLIVSSAVPIHAQSERADLRVFLRNAVVDLEARTVTLPVYEGDSPSGPVWYIVTEISNRSQARKLGVNWSPRLTNALGTKAVRTATSTGGRVRFAGTVDFSPSHLIVPDPGTLFPPTVANPGAVADSLYSPLFTLGNRTVVNAPHVANASGLHDKVVSIDINAGVVTIALTDGFYEGDRVLYISTEASIPLASTLERATYTPNLAETPTIASDTDTSGRQGIVLVVNGETGADNPERQGLQSALSSDGDPLNVIQVQPRDQEYSPLWDGHLLLWTENAIATDRRQVIRDTEDVEELLDSGLAVSAADGPQNPSIGGLRAAGFVVNCPVVAIFK